MLTNPGIKLPFGERWANSIASTQKRGVLYFSPPAGTFSRFPRKGRPNYRVSEDLSEQGHSRQPSRAGVWWELLRWALLRFALLAIVWWVLTEGHRGSWGVGIPFLIAATCASLFLRSSHGWRWRLGGLARFLPVFFWLSWRGGFDVALRAFHPRCPLTPGLFCYPLGLPTGPARNFFVNTVSLLPGTLSADLEEDQLTVHVLDENLSLLESLQSLELLVADLFGLPGAPGNFTGDECHD